MPKNLLLLTPPCVVVLYYVLVRGSSRGKKKKVLIKLDIKFYKCHFSMLIWDLTKRVDTTISVKVQIVIFSIFSSEKPCTHCYVLQLQIPSKLYQLSIVPKIYLPKQTNQTYLKKQGISIPHFFITSLVHEPPLRKRKRKVLSSLKSS